MIDYIAAGFDPAAFWFLTPRLFDFHMRGAIRRMTREADINNRNAYNQAALIAGSMGHKLPDFENVFRAPAKARVVQPPDVLEANIRALARIWGA